MHRIKSPRVYKIIKANEKIRVFLLLFDASFDLLLNRRIADMESIC